MSAQLAQLQEDRAQYQEQLDLVLASLNDDPGNDELLALKAELQSALEIIDDSMAELKPEPTSSKAASKTESYQKAPADSSSASAAHDESSAPVVYKVNESILARWVTGDKGFYPARIMSVTGSATAPMYTVKFKSYDTIETLRARDIRPIAPPNNSGSGSVTSATKRKADGSSVGGSGDAASASVSHRGSAMSLSPSTATSTPPPPPPPTASSSTSSAVPAPPQPPQSSHLYGQPLPPPPPPPSSAAPAVVAAVPPASTAIPPPSRFRTIDRFSQGVVSSAQPQLYDKPPQQQQQQWSSSGGAIKDPATNATPLGEEPPVKKFKKIKATKQLEAGKSKWQEFSSKGKTGKPGTKKDSMFRTPDGPQGRVGFIGSGQAMRKDVTRSRHIYQSNDDVD
ncbi:hypothetical protein Sste5346_002728 [Sporothrix stenoceras]|uniref:Tudor domain-containing protein n=1 Tax=Sporothrix stenoceras TaxID=5173 RepID=A0ABR3ZI20_9PEZI